MAASEFSGIDVNYFWKVQAVMPWTSGLPSEVTTNTWHFVSDPDTGYTDCLGWLATFYASLGSLFSSLIDRTVGAASFKVYNLADAKPRPPVLESVFTVSPLGAGGIDIPPECALVGSYQAVPRAGVRQGSRRGRLYFGPFQQAASDTDLKRPDPTYTDAIRDAMLALQTSSEASAVARWCVYSPTLAGGWEIPGQSGPPNLSAAVAPIDNGWVDNEWDTQRSRGLPATSRDTW